MSCHPFPFLVHPSRVRRVTQVTASPQPNHLNQTTWGTQPLQPTNHFNQPTTSTNQSNHTKPHNWNFLQSSCWVFFGWTNWGIPRNRIHQDDVGLQRAWQVQQLQGLPVFVGSFEELMSFPIGGCFLQGPFFWWLILVGESLGGIFFGWIFL